MYEDFGDQLKNLSRQIRGNDRANVQESGKFAAGFGFDSLPQRSVIQNACEFVFWFSNSFVRREVHEEKCRRSVE